MEINLYIDELVKNNNITLMSMYSLMLEENNQDLYFDNIYTYEDLKQILIEHIENDDICLSDLLSSVEEHSDLYLFDWSCYGQGATPIETKEELKSILLTGIL